MQDKEKVNTKQGAEKAAKATQQQPAAVIPGKVAPPPLDVAPLAYDVFVKHHPESKNEL